jgi:hypothetical protein
VLAVGLRESDLAEVMARRRIAQESFRFGAKAERQTSLNALAALIRLAGRGFCSFAALSGGPKGEGETTP